mmetsp:Transcript_121781/g.344440  ORF Transcript_121781/g.344440 Transcript_121781/m.344440 type:complete len:200 (-) Transcript_121781:132-731(-)
MASSARSTAARPSASTPMARACMSASSSAFASCAFIALTMALCTSPRGDSESGCKTKGLAVGGGTGGGGTGGKCPGAEVVPSTSPTTIGSTGSTPKRIANLSGRVLSKGMSSFSPGMIATSSPFTLTSSSPGSQPTKSAQESAMTLSTKTWPGGQPENRRPIWSPSCSKTRARTPGARLNVRRSGRRTKADVNSWRASI